MYAIWRRRLPSDTLQVAPRNYPGSLHLRFIRRGTFVFRNHFCIIARSHSSLYPHLFLTFFHISPIFCASFKQGDFDLFPLHLSVLLSYNTILSSPSFRYNNIQRCRLQLISHSLPFPVAPLSLTSHVSPSPSDASDSKLSCHTRASVAAHMVAECIAGSDRLRVCLLIGVDDCFDSFPTSPLPELSEL